MQQEKHIKEENASNPHQSYNVHFSHIRLSRPRSGHVPTSPSQLTQSTCGSARLSRRPDLFPYLSILFSLPFFYISLIQKKTFRCWDRLGQTCWEGDVERGRGRPDLSGGVGTGGAKVGTIRMGCGRRSGQRKGNQWPSLYFQWSSGASVSLPVKLRRKCKIGRDVGTGWDNPLPVRKRKGPTYKIGRAGWDRAYFFQVTPENILSLSPSTRFLIDSELKRRFM